MEASNLRKRMPVSALVIPTSCFRRSGQPFVKLNPRTLIKNPVMFVVEVVTAFTTVLFLRDLSPADRTWGSRSRSSSGSG